MPRHAFSAFSFCAVLLCWSAQAQMGPPQVIVAPVESRAVAKTQPLVASVEPITRSTVAAEEAGLVSERNFDEGQRIEKGTLLVKANTEVVASQREVARAAQQSATAMLDRAKADAENAARELKRIEELHRRQVSTEKEYQDALTMSRAMEAMIGVRQAEIAEKSADVARLDLLMKKAEIRAPMTGYVVRRHVEVGQWIKQGEAVADIVPLDPIFVRTHVPEGVISRVRPGDSATVIVDALEGKTFTGTVEQIIPEGDMNSRAFPVKILVPNPNLELRPGFFARAVLSSKGEKPSFLVPRDSVVTRAAGSHVVTVRNGLAVVVPVTLGQSDGANIVVSGELNASDQVVTRGNENLRGGEQPIVLNAPRGPAGPGAPGEPAGGPGGGPGTPDGARGNAGPGAAGENKPASATK